MSEGYGFWSGIPGSPSYLPVAIETVVSRTDSPLPETTDNRTPTGPWRQGPPAITSHSTFGTDLLRLSTVLHSTTSSSHHPLPTTTPHRASRRCYSLRQDTRAPRLLPRLTVSSRLRSVGDLQGLTSPPFCNTNFEEHPLPMGRVRVEVFVLPSLPLGSLSEVPITPFLSVLQKETSREITGARTNLKLDWSSRTSDG